MPTSESPSTDLVEFPKFAALDSSMQTPVNLKCTFCTLLGISNKVNFQKQRLSGGFNHIANALKMFGEGMQNVEQQKIDSCERKTREFIPSNQCITLRQSEIEMETLKYHNNI